MSENQKDTTTDSSASFTGDLDRNEVQLNLDKFMQVLQENGKLKDEIRDIKMKNDTNPWQKWIHLSRMVNSWRIFPRAFITVYMAMVYFSTMWFMGLDDPSGSQAGFISTVVGAGAAWFGLYTRSIGDGE